MKNRPLLLVILLGLLAGCSKSSDVVPTGDLVGSWQLKSAKVHLRAKANGKAQTIDDNKTGKSTEVLEFKSNGTVTDPTDIFDSGTYSWKYSIKGSELTLQAAPDDVGYFTINKTGSTMIWQMSKEQAIRSSKDSGGYSSVLNGGTDDFDELQELDFTLEFTKK